MYGTVPKFQHHFRQKELNICPIFFRVWRPATSFLWILYWQDLFNKETASLQAIQQSILIKPSTLANSYRHSHQSLNNLLWKFCRRLPPSHVILIPFPRNCCMKTLTFIFPQSQTSSISTSLASGVVPPDLKTAIVKALLKKKKKNTLHWQRCSEKLQANFKPAISV